jgi:hypothetical protein
MLNPVPSRRLTIAQAIERFKPMLESQIPAGYIAPQLEQTQWYDAKEGKPWAGSLLDKVKPFFPAENAPSMQRVVANKNLQLHMPVQSAYLALPPSHPQHRWAATLVLEFPATFPRQQALLSIKGEAALQWKVDKPYQSLSEDVLNMTLYVNGLAQLVSDGQATAVLVGLQAWPSAGGAAPVPMDLAPPPWDDSPQGQSFIQPLASLITNMYGACRAQPNAFNPRVAQYLFALPRPANGPTKGTCRARLVFPPLFPANPALGSGVLLLCSYNGSHTHQIINVTNGAISSNVLTTQLAAEFGRRITDALVGIHGPLPTPVSSPTPPPSSLSSPTLPSSLPNGGVGGPVTPAPLAVVAPTSSYPPPSAAPIAIAVVAVPPPSSSAVSSQSLFQPPPITFPSSLALPTSAGMPTATSPLPLSTSPQPVSTSSRPLAVPASSVTNGYPVVTFAPSSSPPISSALSTPIPVSLPSTNVPVNGFRVQWYSSTDGKQMLGSLVTLMKTKFGDCKIERSTVTGDIELIVGPSNPIPRLRLEFPFNFPSSLTKLYVGKHFPIHPRYSTRHLFSSLIFNYHMWFMLDQICMDIQNSII